MDYFRQWCLYLCIHQDHFSHSGGVDTSDHLHVSWKRQTDTGNVLLVASTPYYIYVKEEFKAEIIAKIDEIRGVPHLPSSNKHALLSKNITMVTPQFVQVLQYAFVDSVTKLRSYGGRN